MMRDIFYLFLKAKNYFSVLIPHMFFIHSLIGFMLIHLVSQNYVQAKKTASVNRGDRLIQFDAIEKKLIEEHKKGVPFYYFYPYLPRKTEWNIELGSMWEKGSMYWLGLMYGKNIGSCILTTDKDCQQYLDLIFGVGGSDSYTNGMLAPSLRWQFVSFPKTMSYSVRVLGGVMSFSDNIRDKKSLIYGLGFGLTRTVTKNIDLKLEYRLGGGDQLWSQLFISFGVRLGSFIEHFANKLEKLGVSTMNRTHQILKKSGKMSLESIKKIGNAGAGLLKSEKDSSKPLNKSKTPLTPEASPKK